MNGITDPAQEYFKDGAWGWDPAGDGTWRKILVDSDGKLIVTGCGAWDFIAETELDAPAATVTFAVIPQTYRSLVMISQARTDRVAEVDSVLWRANGDAGARYALIAMFAETGVLQILPQIGRTSGVAGRAEAANSRADCFAVLEAIFPGYARDDRDHYNMSQSVTVGNVSHVNDLATWQIGSHWQAAALTAITSLTLLPGTGPNFVAGSIFTLYGIS